MTSSVSAAAYAASENVGPGSGGFLAFIGLIVLVIGLTFAMRHSFKTLRRNLQDGTFEEGVAKAEAARHPAATGNEDGVHVGTVVESTPAASRPKRRGDAGV